MAPVDARGLVRSHEPLPQATGYPRDHRIARGHRGARQEGAKLHLVDRVRESNIAELGLARMLDYYDRGAADIDRNGIGVDGRCAPTVLPLGAAQAEIASTA